MKPAEFQVKIQKVGSKLSAMVMPNIGVFIGWGIMAALFIENGWLPNETIAQLVNPIMKYLIPLLIAYTAGFNVHGMRGGVIAAFSTIGMIIGAEMPMLIGAMTMGPLAAQLCKFVDRFLEGKIKSGFEMLVNNLTIGFIGLVLCLIGFLFAAPVMTAIQNFFSMCVNFLMDHYLLPLAALVVQPAQVLFLNNAINHGILVPLGIQQATAEGVSPLFFIEANGGYWVGLVVAFAVFGSKAVRKNAAGAAVIQLFGGIAETCFPFCLMKPITLLGPLAGNIFALTIMTFFGGGAIGPPSPGSVFMFYMMTPKDCMFINTIVYFGSLIVSFLVTAVILKASAKKEKSTGSYIKEATGGSFKPIFVDLPIKALNRVVFACDAGMGSSAMGVSILKTRMMKAGMHPKIDHFAVANIPNDTDCIVTNANLAQRAKEATNSKVPIITISNFMDQNEYDRIVDNIKTLMTRKQAKAASKSLEKPALFSVSNIVLNAKFKNKEEAINACADIFIKGNYTDENYRKDMIERDKNASVYIGSGVAMPHGLDSSKDFVKNSGICFIQVPKGVDFDGETAYVLIGVAGKGEEHVELLGKIGQIMCQEQNVEALKKAHTKEDVLFILDIS